MKKEIMLDSISKILNDFNHCCKNAKIPQKLPNKADTLSWEQINEAYKWFHKYIVPIFDKYTDIRKLLPEEIWKRYEEWTISNELHEMRYMTNLYKELRKMFKAPNNPILFNKKEFKEHVNKQRKIEKAKRRGTIIKETN